MSAGKSADLKVETLAAERVALTAVQLELLLVASLVASMAAK